MEDDNIKKSDLELYVETTCLNVEIRKGEPFCRVDGRSLYAQPCDNTCLNYLIDFVYLSKQRNI